MPTSNSASNVRDPHSEFGFRVSFGIRISEFGLPFLVVALAVAVTLLAGCTAPIGADRVTTRQAYAQVEASALRSGKPGPNTVSILHRYDLDRLAAEHPDEAVRQLHQRAVATGERDLLFALAEMSYVAGDRIRRSVKPWDPRDASRLLSWFGGVCVAVSVWRRQGPEPLAI